MNNKNVCILLADGFEEVEAIYPADIFKRLGLNVLLTGVGDKIAKRQYGCDDFSQMRRQIFNQKRRSKIKRYINYCRYLCSSDCFA